MEKVTGVPGEHMTREDTLSGVEEIIGKTEPKGKKAEAEKPAAPADKPAETTEAKADSDKPADEKHEDK